MADDSLDLLRGTVDLLILRTVTRGPMHGYGISHWLRQRSGGALELQDAALYQALRRMERKGWLEAEWGVSENNRRARYYSLTPAGERQLRSETAAWRAYASVVAKVLEPSPGEAR